MSGRFEKLPKMVADLDLGEIGEKCVFSQHTTRRGKADWFRE